MTKEMLIANEPEHKQERVEEKKESPGLEAEAREGKENVAEKSIRRIAEEHAKFGTETDEMLETAKKVTGLSEDDTEGVISKDRVLEKLNDVREREQHSAATSVEKIIRSLGQAPISRRGFLVRMSSLLGAALTAELLSLEARSENAEKYSEPYDKRIMELSQEVLNDRHEKLLFYTRTGKKEKWIKGRDQLETSGIVPFAAIDEILADNPERLEILHTHPLETMVAGGTLSEEKAARIRESEELRVASPPSTMDIVGAVGMKEKYQDTPTDITFSAVDPTGAWEYVPDITSPFSREMLKRAREGRNILNQLMSNSSFQRYGMRHAREITHTDPRLLLLRLEKSGELDEEAKKGLKKIVELETRHVSENFKNIQELNLRIPHSLPPDRDKLIHEFIERYRQEGVRVSYRSFDEIAKSRMRGTGIPEGQPDPNEE